MASPTVPTTPGPPVLVRPMEEGDEAAIARLAREGFEESLPFAWEENARGLASGARTGRVSVLVAILGREPVAYVNLRPWLEGGWIDQIAVARDHHRRGIGSRLVEGAVSVARGKGMGHIGVMVAGEDARAGAFWRSMGWKPVGPVEGALGRGKAGLLLNRSL